MTQLPAAFTEKTRLLMGEERFERYLQSFEEEPPVSIRALVPWRLLFEAASQFHDGSPAACGLLLCARGSVDVSRRGIETDAQRLRQP